MREILLPARRLSLLFAVALAAEVPMAAPAAVAETAPLPVTVQFAGQSLAAALATLRERGLRLVWSERLVEPAMTVGSEPTARQPRAILDELLEPHGLAAREGPGETLVVVRGHAPPDSSAEASLPTAVFTEELAVTPSQISLLRETPLAPLSLGREEILALPHLGDDLFRALTLLPGATGNDVSAQFYVRGSRRDETAIFLDRQEIFDVYHLKDYDGAASSIASTTLAAADLSTGGFAARYGDRMSGVLDMTTVRPESEGRYWVGVSAMSAQLGGSGGFAGGRGTWLAAGRRGATDLVSELVDSQEDPIYWDVYSKVEVRAGEASHLRGNVLFADDELSFDERVGGESKRFDTEYTSAHLWLGLDNLIGANILVQSAAASARIERDRRGAEVEEDVRFLVRDEREMEVTELRQDWTWAAPREQVIDWGLLWRNFSSDYDYAGTHDFDNPLARLRHDFGRNDTVFVGEFAEQHSAVYASDRFRPLPSLSIELGARHDHYRARGEDSTSPRVNLAWAAGSASVVRLAWGRFDQSQRLYELQVEDGEQTFAPLERSQHHVLSFETVLVGGAARPRLAARVEAYRRDVENPRPRYENLYEPINTFPEVEPDRVRFSPEESRAEGAELFLRGTLGKRWSWWLNYAHASTEDRFEGVWTPRLYDERHAVKLDLDWSGERWRFNLAWRYHTGWPTTPLTAQPVFGEPEEPKSLAPIRSRPATTRARKRYSYRTCTTCPCWGRSTACAWTRIIASTCARAGSGARAGGGWMLSWTSRTSTTGRTSRATTGSSTRTPAS